MVPTCTCSRRSPRRTPPLVPPPYQPTDFKVGSTSDGSITLKRKAKHPEGSDRVVYFVQRKLINESAFTLVGGSGEEILSGRHAPRRHRRRDERIVTGPAVRYRAGPALTTVDRDLRLGWAGQL
jgi:hypothetical protein